MAFDFREKLRNPFVQQYAIEILFPLIGYFFFGWGILLIGVYYLLDRFASQLLFFRRLVWMRKKGNESSFYLILSIVLSFIWITIEIVALVYSIHLTQNTALETIGQEVYAFTLDELWFLFPLVILMYHLKDQFTFYMPRHYLKFDYVRSVKWNLVGGGLQLALLVLGMVLWIQFFIPNWAVIFIFVSVKIGYDLFVKNRLERYALMK